MTDNRELDETLDVDPQRATEAICTKCWIIYNGALPGCPSLECTP